MAHWMLFPATVSVPPCQVIEEALKVWDLQLVRWGSADAADMGSRPDAESAFICQRHDHWFGLRKLHGQVRYHCCYRPLRYVHLFGIEISLRITERRTRTRVDRDVTANSRLLFDKH